MSHEEQHTVNKLASDLSSMKKWFPIIAIICTIAGSLITGTFKLTSVYNNDLAKKPEVEKILEKVESINQVIVEIKNDFKEYREIRDVKEKDAENKQAEAKRVMQNHINWVNRQIAKINSNLAFYNQKYYFDKNGNRVISMRPIPRAN